jgi:hypothetical protein
MDMFMLVINYVDEAWIPGMVLWGYLKQWKQLVVAWICNSNLLLRIIKLRSYTKEKKKVA